VAGAPTCIAIDWSGDATAAGQRRKIVAAIVRDGRVSEVMSRRTRAEVAHWLETTVGTGTSEVGPTLVGFDFSFSVPKWFAHAHGCTSIDAVWTLVAEHGEHWLRECEPPFWGRPATRCTLATADRYRACEQRLRARQRQPKSIFQIGGAGAVGTGSLRGMPWLQRLRERGFAIWPFDAVGACTAFEVYPSLYATVTTNDEAGRAAHLAQWPSTVLAPRDREAAIASDDAFDAVVSAFAMWEGRAALLSSPAATDGAAVIEGDIWTWPPP
jgi:Protein of unknown function (DUF429)